MEKEQIKLIEKNLQTKLTKENSRFYEPSKEESYIFLKSRIFNGAFYEMNIISCYKVDGDKLDNVCNLYYNSFKNFIKAKSIFLERIQFINDNYKNKGLDNLAINFLIEIASITFKKNIICLPLFFYNDIHSQNELLCTSNGFNILEFEDGKVIKMEYIINKMSILKINNIRKTSLEYISYIKAQN